MKGYYQVKSSTHLLLNVLKKWKNTQQIASPAFGGIAMTVF